MIRKTTRPRIRLHDAVVAAALCVFAIAYDAPSVAAGPQDGTWAKVRFMYTDRPPAADAWLAPLLARYGPRPFPNALPGLPTIYAVFDNPGAGRTILTVSLAEGCQGAPQGRNAKLAPDPCPTYVLTAYPDGRVRATRHQRGCFLWIDASEGLNDANANAVYVRHLAKTARIEVKTLIDGRPVPECTMSVPIDAGG